MSEAVESMEAARNEATAYPPRSVGWYAVFFGMATLIAICCPIGALFLALGFRAMREAVADAERCAS